MGVDEPRARRGSGTQAYGTPEPATADEREHPSAPPVQGSEPPPASAPPDARTQMQMAPEPQDDPLLGQMLVGRYLIEKKLGEGGMGSVYLATHAVLEKRVALKVLHGEFARKPELIERFLQEAKAASRIRHEHVIDITDFGQTDDGLVFFAMELLDGQDLAEELGRCYVEGGRMPWERSRHIFLQVCSALSAAHRKGIIHRDLKPENIYLVERFGEGDFVKLLDFGIAKVTEATDAERKLTRTGMLFGTPEYMSPEQARGEKVDSRVDVYAMGCILFQMIVGRVPFEADNFMGILTLHLTQPTPLMGDALAQVGAPVGLEGIVQKALAKERDARYATIDEMMEAILVLDDGLGSDVPTPRREHMLSTGVPAAELSGGGTARTQWKGQVKLPAATAGEDAAGGAARSKTGLWVALGAVAVLAIGGAVMALTGGGDEPAPAAATGEAVPAPAEPTIPAPVVVPEEPARIAVHIESVPPGATVVHGSTGEALGVTPFDVALPKGAETTTYELQLEGYETQTVLVSHSSPFDRSFELDKKRTRRPGRKDPVALPRKGTLLGDPDKPKAGGGGELKRVDFDALEKDAKKPE